MGTASPPDADEARRKVLEGYENRIAYYWKASQYNKRSH